MRHAEGQRLTRILLEAVDDTGVRAVIAQATSDIGSGLDHSENIYVLKDYPIPHHVLFPRLQAAVHHGSWITTHLAARAGIPQLVLPQASDQYLWSEVVRKNGLGPRGVDMNRLKTKKLSRAIEQLTRRPDYEANARALGERVSGIDGARNALELFEKIKGRLVKRTDAPLARKH
jgi:UDP:flavonoid glycosyltransferase YjiC (YdhE family)